MASTFSVYAVPESHISYFMQHQRALGSYLNGEPPEGMELSSVPEDWPIEPPRTVVEWNANDRNPELYHWILNGSRDLVRDGGSIFQTWFEPDNNAAVKLDDYNEAFAFNPSQLQRLADLAANVDLASVKVAFAAWCASEGKNYSPDDSACEPFVEEFKSFAQGLSDAIRSHHGLVWVPL